MKKILLLLVLVTIALSCLFRPPKCYGGPSNKRKFQLQFQYACRNGVSFNSCKGDVFWNGKKIFTVAPRDYKVRTKTLNVFVKVGDNSLKFQGRGCSDRRGLTIDNVRLVRYGSKVNIVVNGGF